MRTSPAEGPATAASTADLVAGGGHSRAGLLAPSALAIDVAAVALAATVAFLGRRDLPFFNTRALEGHVPVAATLVLLGWPLAIWVLGGYRASVFGAGTDEFKLVVNAGIAVAALTGIACYLTKFPLSRGFYLLLFIVGIPLLVGGRFVLRRLIHRLRVHGRLRHRVVIAGAAGHVDELTTILHRETWLGYDVVGALVPDEPRGQVTPGGVVVLGGPGDAAYVLEAAGADVLLLGGGAFASATQTRELAWTLEHQRVQLVMAPSLTDVARERVAIRPVAGLPLVHVDTPRAVDASHWAKRTFDVAGALVLLVLLSPIMTGVALAVRLDDGGPVLYRQIRVGRDGRHFRCLKFRSMVVDADRRRADLVTASPDAPMLFKLADDPRITRPGRVIRRLSLDELPQLLNVLRGDMSLVGPRPPLPSEVARYDAPVHRRLRVRPGMTGLWQVSGRSDLSWEDTVRLDLYYVDNWSMTRDLVILARTVGAVVRSRGAY